MCSTPKNIPKFQPAHRFSPVTVNESPVNKILQCGNLTGNSRRMRDLVAEFYNLIQEWNNQHLLGIKILNTIMSVKLSILMDSEATDRHLYPEGLQEQCDHLDEILKCLNEVFRKLETAAQQMYSVRNLEKLQNTNKTPLFLTWPTEKYGQISDEVCNAYRKELQAKKRVKNNIAHCHTKETLMYHIATWVHQPYIDSAVDLHIESMLYETGHKQ